MTNGYKEMVNKDLLSAPGVIDVTTKVNLNESFQDVITEAAKHAHKLKLGLNGLLGPFNHVAFVVEQCFSIGTLCNMAVWGVRKPLAKTLLWTHSQG